MKTENNKWLDDPCAGYTSFIKRIDHSSTQFEDRWTWGQQSLVMPWPSMCSYVRNLSSSAWKCSICKRNCYGCFCDLYGDVMDSVKRIWRVVVSGGPDRPCVTETMVSKRQYEVPVQRACGHFSLSCTASSTNCEEWLNTVSCFSGLVSYKESSFISHQTNARLHLNFFTLISEIYFLAMRDRWWYQNYRKKFRWVIKCL